VHPDSFEPEKLGRGRKHALELQFEFGDQGIVIPVFVFRGAREGKVLVVISGVHGDEYEGPRTILELCSTLDPAEMTGDLIAVPVAHPPAFWAGTRASPLDGRDLARTFPGDLASGPTYAIAYYLARAVIARADLFVDLHSGGVKYSMPTMAGYDATDPRSLAAARAFGAKVIWGHPTTPPGRTISFAKDHGIPSLYTEAKGAGRIDPEDLRTFKQGFLNLLKYLSILPGDPAIQPIECHLWGDGNTELSMRATRAGFLIPSVSLLDRVREGQELGRLVDLHGGAIETFHAPSHGVIGMIREFPVVEPDNIMFLVTGLNPQA
jgi:uncharacterized protein